MIELITIGTELLQGRENTNAAYIGESLSGIGLAISRFYTVKDDEREIARITEQALKESRIVITTGGLGPTFDDVTKRALSGVLKKELVFNEKVFKRIEEYFSDIKIKMPSCNRNQAYIIEGAKIIHNKIGTAPGMILEIPVKDKQRASVTLIVLPGPPAELHAMFDEVVLSYLKERFKQGFLKRKTLHVCGLTESDVYDKIREVIKMERKLEEAELSFSILARASITEIKISAQGSDDLLVEDLLHKATSEIYECLGDDIYGEDGQTLEELVGFKLGKKKETLAVAESCTGGFLSNRITNIPGSSLYFKEGVIAYSSGSKIRVLGVKEKTLKEHGSVSSQTAREMAKGARERAGTDYGLATTGIAGPGGGTPRKPVGMVFIALATDTKEIVKEIYFSGPRSTVKEKVSTAALDLLRRNIPSVIRRKKR